MNTTNEFAMLAQDWLELDPVFLDTETTGLGATDEICEIAVVDKSGKVLLCSLVRPTVPISTGAFRVHSIDEALLAENNAPTLADLWPKIHSVLDGKLVIAYNVSFDEKMLHQSFVGAKDPHDGIERPWPAFESRCAMLLFSDYIGDYNAYHGNNRWQPLWRAVSHFNIQLSGELHRALADAEACRQVVLKLAEVQDE